MLAFPVRPGASTWLCAAVLIAATPGALVAPAQPMPPARDPALAVAEEFALAEDAGTSAALILFIARHPGTAAAAAARDRLAIRAAPDPAPPPGPDGAIIAAFDAARRAGPAALRAFAARYPGHPLAAEAAVWGPAAPR